MAAAGRARRASEQRYNEQPTSNNYFNGTFLHKGTLSLSVAIIRRLCMKNGEERERESERRRQVLSGLNKDWAHEAERLARSERTALSPPPPPPPSPFFPSIIRPRPVIRRRPQKFYLLLSSYHSTLQALGENFLSAPLFLSLSLRGTAVALSGADRNFGPRREEIASNIESAVKRAASSGKYLCLISSLALSSQPPSLGLSRSQSSSQLRLDRTLSYVY